MKATELRIGNLINHDNGHVYWSVDSISNYELDITIDDHQGDITVCCVIYKSVQPIPLTEEWLLKFGFEKDEDNDFYLDASYFDICYQNKKWYLRQDGELFDLIDIDYVHQFQNLYFALTGEELKIKESEKKQNC